MSSSQLIRLSGLAAIAGGLLILLARVFQVALFGSQPHSVHALSPAFVLALGLPGLAGSIGLSLGSIGLYARQADRLGLWGLLAFVIAHIGLALSLGANWAYAFASPYLGSTAPRLLDPPFNDPAWGMLGMGLLVSYLLGALGWLIMSGITLIGGVLPRWVGAVMLGSMLLAALSRLGTLGPPAIVLNLLLAVGPIVFGYALWAGMEKSTTSTSVNAA